MRQPTKEAQEKAVAASVEKKAAQMRNRERRFTVGNWTVFRMDDFNFVLEKITRPAGEGDDQKYYPSFEDAVRRMLRELINDKSMRAKDVESVLAAMMAASMAVTEALKASHGNLPV